MFPRLFRFKTPDFLSNIFPEYIELHSYGFFIALGALVVFFFMLKRVKKFKVYSEDLANLFIWCILAAFVGGKLFFFFEDWSKYMANPKLMLKLTGGGFVFYGSLLFVVPTMILWLKKYKIPVIPFLDILAFIGPILHVFGRVGCFMAGCCYGKVCNNALGIRFTNELTMARPINTPLYPTQLFDILINLTILVFIFWMKKRQQFHGQLLLLYLSLYAVGRSINELFRGDEERGFVFNGWLSHSQLIAIIIISVCAFLYVRWMKNPELKIDAEPELEPLK